MITFLPFMLIYKLIIGPMEETTFRNSRITVKEFSLCLRPYRKVKVKLLSHVWLFATTWTVAYQASPSKGFSRQKYWTGLPFPSPTGNWECLYSVQIVTDFACLISTVSTHTAESFCASKGTINRVKGNPWNGRKYLQITYLIRNSHQEYIKKILKLNKNTTQLKKWKIQEWKFLF